MGIPSIMKFDVGSIVNQLIKSGTSLLSASNPSAAPTGNNAASASLPTPVAAGAIMGMVAINAGLEVKFPHLPYEIKTSSSFLSSLGMAKLFSWKTSLTTLTQRLGNFSVITSGISLSVHGLGRFMGIEGLQVGHSGHQLLTTATSLVMGFFLATSAAVAGTSLLGVALTTTACARFGNIYLGVLREVSFSASYLADSPEGRLEHRAERLADLKVTGKFLPFHDEGLKNELNATIANYRHFSLETISALSSSAGATYPAFRKRQIAQSQEELVNASKNFIRAIKREVIIPSLLDPETGTIDRGKAFSKIQAIYEDEKDEVESQYDLFKATAHLLPEAERMTGLINPDGTIGSRYSYAGAHEAFKQIAREELPALIRETDEKIISLYLETGILEKINSTHGKTSYRQLDPQAWSPEQEERVEEEINPLKANLEYYQKLLAIL